MGYIFFKKKSLTPTFDVSKLCNFKLPLDKTIMQLYCLQSVTVTPYINNQSTYPVCVNFLQDPDIREQTPKLQSKSVIWRSVN
jgi:hypothetical protein